jgi:CubicO group peptidase (beta-lactamase class C family)
VIKRVFTGILISIVVICSNTTLASAAVDNSGQIKTSISAKAETKLIVVNINGKVVSLNETKPYMDSTSKVILPLTPVVKEFDSNASIETKEGRVTLKYGKNTIQFYNGNEEIVANGKHIKLSTKPVINEGQVFVPLQFFSEALDKLVDFDNDTNLVKIYNKEKNTGKYFNDSLFFTKDKVIANKLDNYLTAAEKYDNFSGSVLVAKGGTVLLDKGYNMSNFGQNIKNTPQSTFAIGSMTKQFTATAIMQLVEKGMINEQDKVSKYIPGFPNGDKITIDNLLTHTSGLSELSVPEYLSAKLEDSKKVENIINLFKNRPLYFEPGTKFEYSNSGYIVLGYIVEKVSGMKYADYLQNNIFKPLNMNHTGMGYNGTEKNYNSSGYTGYLDVVPISDEIFLNAIYGAGALYSTTEDLYKWDRALKKHKLVTEATLDKMFSKHVPMSKNNTVYYGYGWMVYDTSVGREIFHGGNVLGFTSYIGRIPEQDLTVIILSNIGYSNIEELSAILTNMSLGAKYEIPKEKKIIKVDSTLLSNCIGEYSFETLGTVSITDENSHLYANFAGMQKYEMFCEAKNQFFFRGFNGTLTFNTDEKGQVTSIDLYQLGMKYSGKKIK